MLKIIASLIENPKRDHPLKKMMDDPKFFVGFCFIGSGWFASKN
jgi:hypothetical protein